MKLLRPLVLPAFSAVAVLIFPVCTLRAQSELPLPTTRSAEPVGARELQRTAQPLPSGPQAEPFSLPAPLTLPPEPSPFPSFPPIPHDAFPPELDLRKRANTALIPEGPNPTEDAALQLRDRVRYRELKLRAAARPEVRSALEAVQKAHSDMALREAWRLYYARLFSAVRALEPALEPLIAQREKEALAPLAEKLPRPVGGR